MELVDVVRKLDECEQGVGEVAGVAAVEREQHVPDLLPKFGVEPADGPEVEEHELAARCEHDVAGMQVRVEDTVVDDLDQCGPEEPAGLVSALRLRAVGQGARVAERVPFDEKRIGRTLDPEDFTDAQAIAAIERITRGNFRLLERLFPQIARVLKINQLEAITDDVVEAAASILVIGD